MALRFLNWNQTATAYDGYISDAITCINHAINKKPANTHMVINASWGDYQSSPIVGVFKDGTSTQWNSLKSTIATAQSKGIIFVAACGNNGGNNDSYPLYPASYTDLDNIIAVAATDQNDNLAVFPPSNPSQFMPPAFPASEASNYGAKTVHLGAPGLDSFSTCLYCSTNPYDGGYWGTSMACAYVSGACALVWAAHPTETYQQIIHRILVSTDYLPSLSGKCVTSGRLNLYGALTVVPGTWTTAGSMNNARTGHTQTLLPNGQVLVTGGFYNGSVLNSAELYDPSTGQWSPTTDSMSTAREGHTATLLPSNGKVLITGGHNPSNGFLNSAELYDPSTTPHWSTINSMSTARANHTATLLSTGKVLVAGGQNSGGYLSSAELYDPLTGWSTAGTMSTTRAYHTATLLGTGKVLIAGGQNSGGLLTNSKLYDPLTGWSTTFLTPFTLVDHTATLLTTGKVLVAGGWNGSTYTASAYLYDPNTGNWSTTTSMNAIHSSHTATLLPDGQALVVGGISNGSNSSAERYDPTASPPTWTFTGSLNTGRDQHTATMWPNGQVLVAGGENSSGGLSSAELYVP
jgi:N-acetylneuraminic acid mutarotase